MPNRNDTCPKCQGTMQVGHVTDNNIGRVVVSSWRAGLPEWGLLKAFTRSAKESFPIIPYRCASCGYVESYTGDPA